MNVAYMKTLNEQCLFVAVFSLCLCTNVNFFNVLKNYLNV